MSIEDLYYSAPVVALLIIGIKVIWGQYIQEKKENKEDRQYSLEIVSNLVEVVEKLRSKTDANDQELRKDLDRIYQILTEMKDGNNNK